MMEEERERAEKARRRDGETASHTTPFAGCTPFLEDFSRRHGSASERGGEERGGEERGGERGGDGGAPREGGLEIRKPPPPPE